MTNIVIPPIPQSPLTDGRTGKISREWFRFLDLLSQALRTNYRLSEAGEVTLVAGTATVNTEFANTLAQYTLTRKVDGGVLGELSVGAIVANTSFVIDSDNAGDTSTVSWVIFSPVGG